MNNVFSFFLVPNILHFYSSVYKLLFFSLSLDNRAREDFSESDWDNENEEEKENERTIGENDEDAAFKLLNHSKTQE